MDRRTFIKGAGTAGLLAALPRTRLLELLAAPRDGSAAGHFLDALEMANLRALTYRLVPGPADASGPLNNPPETDPGAREAHCPEAIDILLGAFQFDPPMIHAGGPFSDRAGAAHDDFADFVRLDRQAELGWRIRLEGSRGIAAREFAGPVAGMQAEYRDGLAHLEDRAQASAGQHFSDLPGAAQDLIISDQSDAATQAFVAQVLGHCIDAMYGPPEYGGNQGLVGWQNIHFRGDSQPRGYSNAEVTDPDPGSGVPPLTAAQARQYAGLLRGAGGRAVANPAVRLSNRRVKRV